MIRVAHNKSSFEALGLVKTNWVRLLNYRYPEVYKTTPSKETLPQGENKKDDKC